MKQLALAAIVGAVAIWLGLIVFGPEPQQWECHGLNDLVDVSACGPHG